jgi:hypothetical protein
VKSAATQLFSVVLTMIAVAPVAAAQPRALAGMPPVRNYLVKAFDAHAQVWTILRDRQGLLYIGTSESDLHQYDGAVWRRIPVPSTTTRSLALDAQGKIWVGGSAEFGYLEPDAAGALKYVSLIDKVPPEHRASPMSGRF